MAAFSAFAGTPARAETDHFYDPFRQDIAALCTDFYGCKARVVRALAPQAAQLADQVVAIMQRVRAEPDSMQELMAAAMDVRLRLTDCRKLRQGRDPRCTLTGDPLAGRGEQLVRGYIGMDRKVCPKTFRNPFQYRLAHGPGGGYEARVKLCLVLDDKSEKYKDFLETRGGGFKNGAATWSEVAAKWKEVLERRWKTSSGIRFAAKVDFVFADSSGACGPVDNVVHLDASQERSDYTHWHLGDTTFGKQTGYFTLTHEFGHLLGLVDEYNEDGHFKLCHPDVTTANENSIMGFSGEMGGGVSEASMKTMRPMRKHFKQIVSNLLINNYRASAYLTAGDSYLSGTGLSYQPVCADTLDALSDRENSLDGESHLLESDGTLYPVDLWR